MQEYAVLPMWTLLFLHAEMIAQLCNHRTPTRIGKLRLQNGVRFEQGSGEFIPLFWLTPIIFDGSNRPCWVGDGRCLQRQTQIVGLLHALFPSHWLGKSSNEEVCLAEVDFAHTQDV